MIIWVLQAIRVSRLAEILVFDRAAGIALLQSFIRRVLYIALESYVCRRWPNKTLGRILRDPARVTRPFEYVFHPHNKVRRERLTGIG